MDNEQVMPQIDSIEALNTLDLTNTDTARPVLKEGAYKFKLLRMELKDQKSGKGKNLIVVIGLDQEAPSTEGKVINAGFQHSEQISLVPTENYNPAENLARIQECFLGKKGKFNAGELLGKQGTIRMRVEDSAQYGKQNRVTWIKAKPVGEAVPSLA
jgi:hypothetical protein